LARYNQKAPGNATGLDHRISFSPRLFPLFHEQHDEKMPIEIPAGGLV
jgi:hypothetical protein